VKRGSRGEVLRDALLASAFAALFLVGLGRPELMDPDESRHAEIARTMLADGRFLTPRLYGEPYYDKPVGYHWTVAASIALFGPRTAAARLPSALSALATLAVTAWWALRIGSAASARLSVAMLGTSLLFVALGRFGGIDMLFTALLTAAVARISVAAGTAAPTVRAALVAYTLVALAILVKGPVALALALPAFAAAWLTTRGKNVEWLVPWHAAATILAIAGPWYAAAANADPVYIRTFLETHNLARFTGSDALAHQTPITYYAAALPLACLPWTPLVGLGSYARLRRTRLSAPEIVLLTWIASVLLLFAAAGTRIVTYLLPAFPSLAVLGATGLVDEDTRVDPRATRRWHRALGIWTLIWGATITAAVAAAAALRIASLGTGADLELTTALLLATVAYGITLMRARYTTSARSALVLLAAGTILAAAAAYGPVADLLTAAKGYRSLGAQMARDLPPDGVVFSLSRAPHALSFYAGHTIGRLDDLDAARRTLGREIPVFLLTKGTYAGALTADPALPVETLWRNAQGTTLLANARAAIEWRRREGVEPSADHDGRHHGFEDRSGHRTRSLSAPRDRGTLDHP